MTKSSRWNGRKAVTGIAAVAGIAMIVPLAACGGANTASSSNEISIFTQNATYEGTLDGYVGKWLKDKTGLTVKVTPSTVGGTDRFQTKLTTGQLGDLIAFNSRDSLKQAIDAGAVEDLSAYKSKLPNAFRFTDAINRMTKMDSGKVYAIPSGAAQKAALGKGDPVNVPSFRYDYYKELGSPEVKTYWDYKDIAEQMAKAHSKTEKGDNMYALSLFGGWDTTSAGQLRSIATELGWITNDGVNSYDFINLQPEEKKVEDILADGGTYLTALKWANSIHQDGLLDPDSATQTWDDYMKKAEKGQSAMWVYGYLGNLNYNPVNKDMTAQNKGYERVPSDDAMSYQATSTLGSNWFWGLAKNSKNKDNAVKFLNFMYGDEGSFGFENGPEGVLWKRNAQGQPELTDLGKGDWSAEVPAKDGGGKVQDTFKARVNTSTGTPTGKDYDFPVVYNQWDSYLKDNASSLDKEWTADHDGALNVQEYLIKKGQVKGFKTPDLPSIEYSDQDKVIKSQVGDVIKQYSWKMIYANSDSEFNSLEKDMVKKAKSLGYDKLVKFETGYADKFFDKVQML
ncbi:extracellular solute-binding protein [Bifidobacterium sp. 82T10]|uniref:Extracellular solute-binding protein n=1 Tax=Bifidobacterium miconis TaxID=2834435 RepID=A0ABS6WCI7_9BIFI|nr:extracellular solute-binding protein [Bifidobacterium miconis]MBW3091769.1 extracellular solute-binding protein [Bifidobacterium miconis]